ncbi:MAG TPA: hypothetical protein VGS57_23040 [Thermoanaerobaculia bacterium]|jgi:hypothetical protein|nr:hypothetical protein [Thermoanaerobaculia bacterium]
MTTSMQHDHPSDEELILYHYGESPDAEAITAILARSAAAQQRYAELRALLAAADAWTPPELPASFTEEVWQRLQPRLATEGSGGAARQRAQAGGETAAAAATAPMPSLDEAPSTGAPSRSDLAVMESANGAPTNVLPAAHRFRTRVRRYVPAAAAAVLLLAVGYIAGRLAPNVAPAPPTLSADSRQRLLAETLADHLERSQRLFTELANASPEETASLAGEQRTAQELLSANRLYRTAAERGGREGVVALLDDMEPVLLELAHLPAEPHPADFEFLRRRIESQNLLFKTRVASELLTRSLRSESAPTTRSTI